MSPFSYLIMLKSWVIHLRHSLATHCVMINCPKLQGRLGDIGCHYSNFSFQLALLINSLSLMCYLLPAVCFSKKSVVTDQANMNYLQGFCALSLHILFNFQIQSDWSHMPALPVTTLYLGTAPSEWVRQMV